MTIFLIGLPACGKTTIAKEVSRRLSMAYMDADAEIERQRGMTIPEIFARHGEEAFRKWETEFLKTPKEKKNILISLGGGVILKEENRLFLRNETVFFIDPAISYSLTQEETEQRPVLKTKSLEQLKQERQLLYEEVATVTIHESTMEEAISKTQQEVTRLCGF